ncbi:MAG TPA: formate dehydrogenase accessory sulfurtransferase FdhD [Puia sp.]|jgi:FdhD protein|nr:formate dehydrogenase accessory sulfurtransferase FdhD [Puia sp.]
MDNALQVSIVKIAGDSVKAVRDLLAIEEPLEIRVGFGDRVQNLAVTMRTPGQDADLALGFLFTEGIIARAADVLAVAPVFLPCSEDKQNTILVTLKEGVVPNLRQAERNFYTTSSCGVCGKASIEAIRTVGAFRAGASEAEQMAGIDPAFILGLPERLAAAQELFAETGGLHGAALFDINGALLLVREDVGRHNAVDKLIGAAMMEGRLPLVQSVLLLSGRASFELVQKAAMAGIPVIAAVGAPSSLAVSLAEEFRMTLIGFLRNNRFNIYSGAHRVNIPVTEY